MEMIKTLIDVFSWLLIAYGCFALIKAVFINQIKRKEKST
jgi:uncharacterized membrane protein